MKDGWVRRPLAEVSEFIGRGVSPKYVAEGGIQVLNQRCVRDHRISVATARRHDDSAKAVADARLVRSGDVLVNSTGVGTLGRVAQVAEDLAEPTTVDSHVSVVRAAPGIFFTPFFGYAMQSIEEDLKLAGQGSGGQTELSRDALKSFTLAYPESLEEQERIVRILDEALDGIATAQANIEANLAYVEALQIAHLTGTFRTGAPWRRAVLGEIAQVQSGGTPLVSNKALWGGDIPWYSSGELNEAGTADPHRSISKAGLEGSNAKLFPRGSLLIGMYDTAALKMSVLDREAAFNQAIAGVRPSDSLDSVFLMYAIQAQKSSLLLERRGVRQKNLSLSKIKSIQVPVPSKAVQIAVVEDLRRVQAESSALASQLQRQGDSLDLLRGSLLQNAFIGKL